MQLRDVFFSGILLVLLSALFACGDDDSSTQSTDSTQGNAGKSYTSAPGQSIDNTRDYTAVFVMEKGGEFTVDLFEKLVPTTVNNFVF